MTEGFAAIILAAGHSSRMGDFKPLLSVGEKTALEHAVALFHGNGIRQVAVVSGHHGERLEPLLRQLGVTHIPNSLFRQGMFTSVQAGVRNLGDEVRAFFLQPVDVPLVRSQTVQTLLHAWLTGQPGIIQPAFNGIYGHPPLISTRYRSAILDYHGEGGLKLLLRSFTGDTLLLELPDEQMLLDMDTPEDYQRLCRRWENRMLPTERECRHLLHHEFALPAEIVAHCLAVARVAVQLADALTAVGFMVNRDLVLAAALLHDCARRSRNHARAGEKALRNLGFPDVAAVVGRHMDLDPPQTTEFSADELVFLADKLVAGNRLVGIEQRFAEKQTLTASKTRASNSFERRLACARAIRHRVEKALGQPLAEILTDHEQTS